MAQGKQQKQQQQGGQVISMRCKSHECSEKPKRAGFCNEHFDWFKEGLITKTGERAKDFDKKYQPFLQRVKEAA